jgi:uncharacterized membrane protein YadS
MPVDQSPDETGRKMDDIEKGKSGVVTDKGKGSISDLWKKEDYWAIWLGFAILIVGALIYFPMGDSYQFKDKKTKEIKTAHPATLFEEKNAIVAEEKKNPFPTVAFYEAKDKKKKMQAKSSTIGSAISKWTGKPKKWTSNPLTSFYMSKDQASAVKEESGLVQKYNDAKKEEKSAHNEAKIADGAAKAAGYQDEGLNAAAMASIKDWRDKKQVASGLKKKGLPVAKSHNQIVQLIVLMIGMGIFFGIGMATMGYSFSKFLTGFTFVFAIACLAFMMANQTTIKGLGIGYAAWAIIIGMLISNTVGTPGWAKPAVQTEYYIKTGLVLLGAKILFGKLVAIGQPGIFVAWVVTPTVWLITYWFGQKIVKMPSKELNATICSDMSVCGVSAAIATAAACKAKKEELTLAVGLSLVFTSIMMIVMPAVIKGFFPADKVQILGGAWMGGTIDATGAVAAAGAFLGDTALYVAATIKMIQNILIGIIAFLVALYWTTRVETASTGQSVGAVEIWHRFPKFVIGFIIASIVFSIADASFGGDLSNTLVKQGVIKGMSDIFRGWFFCLAFVSIGLATNFRELGHHFTGGKPLILYVCGQSLNLVLTLTMAYIMFYLVFPEILPKIDPTIQVLVK